MARIFEGICAEEEYRRIKEGFNKVLDRFAQEGDVKAGEFVRDTTDGKPHQAVTLAGDADNPLVTKIVREVVQPPAKT